MKAMGLPHAIPCVTGQPRKRIRRAMETAFSQSSMRDLFPKMLAKANLATAELLRTGEEDRQAGQSTVDTVTMSTRYMIDLMGQCIFGVEYDSIGSGVPTEFERTVKRYYERRVTLTMWDLKSVRTLFSKVLPAFMSLTATFIGD